MSRITPHLTVRGAAAAIEYYKKVFGAELIANMPDPGGKIMYAELKIGDSILSLNDDFPEMEEKLKTDAGIMGSCAPFAGAASPVVLRLDAEDCDKIFHQAVAAGAKARCRRPTCIGGTATANSPTRLGITGGSPHTLTFADL